MLLYPMSLKQSPKRDFAIPAPTASLRASKCSRYGKVWTLMKGQMYVERMQPLSAKSIYTYSGETGNL